MSFARRIPLLSIPIGGDGASMPAPPCRANWWHGLFLGRLVAYSAGPEYCAVVRVRVMTRSKWRRYRTPAEFTSRLFFGPLVLAIECWVGRRDSASDVEDLIDQAQAAWCETYGRIEPY